MSNIDSIKKSVPKVAVHGSYFADNFGDTLLVKLMCDKVAAIVGRNNVHLAVEGNKKEQSAIGYKVVPRNERHTVTHLIFAGGGYFGEPNTSYINKQKWAWRNYKRHIRWVKYFTNAKISILGVGYGPLSNPMLKFQIDRLVKRADTVLLRDKESVDHLNMGGVRQCVDLALSLESKHKKKNDIGLHLYKIRDRDKIELIELFSNKYPDRTIRLLNDTRSNNYGSGRVVRAIGTINRTRNKRIIVHKYEDVETLLSVIDGCDVVLTTKLHVGITGIAQGVKVISIPIHQKTQRLYRQLGLEEFCLNYKDYSSDEVVIILDKLNSYVLNGDVVKQGIEMIDDALARALISKA